MEELKIGQKWKGKDGKTRELIAFNKHSIPVMETRSGFVDLYYESNSTVFHELL